MVDFAYTQTDTILGKLTNGRKLVLTVITITDAQVGGTTITIKPLKRIIKWICGWRKPQAFDFYCADQGTILNQIVVTPSAAATNSVIELLSVGE